MGRKKERMFIQSMSHPCRRTSRGQALVEFAITGSLALLTLAFLIQMGLRMNYQQEIEQQTFRRALLLAKCEGDEQEPSRWCQDRVPNVDNDDESQGTSLTQFRDRQIPDPSLGFGVMPRTTTSASSLVTWGERLTFLGSDRDSQTRIRVRLNEKQHDYRSEDMQKNQPLVAGFKRELMTNSAVITESDAGNTLSATVTETNTLKLHTKTDSELSSSLESQCTFVGSFWKCGD